MLGSASEVVPSGLNRGALAECSELGTHICECDLVLCRGFSHVPALRVLAVGCIGRWSMLVKVEAKHSKHDKLFRLCGSCNERRWHRPMSWILISERWQHTVQPLKRSWVCEYYIYLITGLYSLNMPSEQQEVSFGGAPDQKWVERSACGAWQGFKHLPHNGSGYLHTV